MEAGIPSFLHSSARGRSRQGRGEKAMADEIEDQIEAAEEAGDVPQLLAIIDTCSKHGGNEEWEGAAEASLDAFYRVVKGRSGTDPPLPDNSLSTIFESMGAWKGEEAIAEVALGCIVATSSKSSTQTVDSIDVNLILELMRTYEDEATIQEQACLAIEGLANSSDILKTRICDIAGIKDELAAASERITNERNKKYPGQAAAALGIQL